MRGCTRQSCRMLCSRGQVGSAREFSSLGLALGCPEVHLEVHASTPPWSRALPEGARDRLRVMVQGQAVGCPGWGDCTFTRTFVHVHIHVHSWQRCMRVAHPTRNPGLCAQLPHEGCVLLVHVAGHMGIARLLCVHAFRPHPTQLPSLCIVAQPWPTVWGYQLSPRPA